MVESGSLVKMNYVVKADGQTVENAENVVIAVGKNHVLKGFDEVLQSTEVGKQTEVDLPAEKAYGNRNPELIRLVPLEGFRRQNIEPVAGMVVELDGMPAKVQSVSGGRVRVDFNHELAGKTLHYSFKITERLTTPLARASAIATQFLGNVKCSFDEVSKTATIQVDEKTCLKQGYLMAKGRSISTILSFAEGVEKVKVIEEYSKAAATGSNV